MNPADGELLSRDRMPLAGEESNPYLDLEDRLAGGAIAEATASPVMDLGVTEPVPALPLAAGEQLAFQRAPGAPASPPAAPAPRPNPYVALEDALTEHDQAKDAMTSQLFDAAFTKAPDEHAAILEIARKTRVPASVVEQQFPMFKAQWEASQRDPRRFREENPDMWGLLFDQPDKAPVVLQDEQISGLARIVRGVARYTADHPILGAPMGGALTTGEALDLEDQLNGRVTTKTSRTADFSKKQNVPYELDPASALEGAERLIGKWAWVPVGDGEVDLQQTDPSIFQAEWRNTSKGNDAAKLGAERMALRAARAALNPDVAGAQVAELDRRIWETDKRATDLEAQITSKTYNAGPLEQVLVDVASIAPSQVETLKGGGMGGAAGALIGGALGFATRSPGAAGRLARAGYRLGSKAGAALTSFTLESGSAFNQTIGEKLDDGTFVDENVATGASIVYGAIASAIEMEAMGKALGMFGPMGDAIAKSEGRAFLRGVLRDAKLRAIFGDIGKRWLRGAYAEGQEEFLQQAAQDTIDYLGRSAQAGGWQKADVVGGLEAATEIGARTFVGTAAMGAPASTLNLGTQLMYRDRVIKAGQVVAAAVKLGKESLATRASPEFVADLIQKESERSGERVVSMFSDQSEFAARFAGWQA